MGVLDSFKQDAFLCSQTQDCTTRKKNQNQTSRWTVSWKNGWKPLSCRGGDQRESRCPHKAVEKEARGVQKRTTRLCNVPTPPVTSLFCVVSISHATITNEMGEKEAHPPPNTSYPTAGIWNVPIPPRWLWTQTYKSGREYYHFQSLEIRVRDLFQKINLGSNKTHGFDSGAAGRGSAGGCGWVMRTLSSLERYRSMKGGQSIVWTHSSATQTLKPALFSSILPGLDDCSPRACLFLLN